jgi:hypothetical protein
MRQASSAIFGFHLDILPFFLSPVSTEEGEKGRREAEQ